MLRLRTLFAALAVVIAAASLTACEPQPYDLAFFGDVPYSSSAAGRYDQMLADINAQNFPVSFHVGDIGPGSDATCTDATVDRETARFDTVKRALVYTPGDNEWRDCDEQLERLAYIRQEVFRSTGTLSRGTAPIKLSSEADDGYPENTRFSKGAVTIASLHVVGSKDNYSHTSEFTPRRTATIAWLQATFDVAEDRGDKGVILLAQADPDLDQSQTGDSRDAYQSMFEAIRSEVAAFDGQVLFINGDGHAYRNLTPIPSLPNLRQIQVEGDSKVSYVRVHVDTTTSEVFTITAPKRF